MIVTVVVQQVIFALWYGPLFVENCLPWPLWWFALSFIPSRLLRKKKDLKDKGVPLQNSSPQATVVALILGAFLTNFVFNLLVANLSAKSLFGFVE